MTFSITARCPNTGAFGVAISSSSIAVASRCVWPGPMGAVTTQNLTNAALGATGQNLLRQGLGAGGVLSTALAGDPAPDWRQVAVIDRYGVIAAHCGDRSFPESNMSIGAGVIAMGNLLAAKDVTQSMLEVFTGLKEDFAERLMRALEAGLAAGGENVPVKSAGLKIYQHHDWPVVDLRVDWADDPIQRLRTIWNSFRPQQADFLEWARDPNAAAASMTARAPDAG